MGTLNRRQLAHDLIIAVGHDFDDEPAAIGIEPDDFVDPGITRAADIGRHASGMQLRDGTLAHRADAFGMEISEFEKGWHGGIIAYASASANKRAAERPLEAGFDQQAAVLIANGFRCGIHPANVEGSSYLTCDRPIEGTGYCRGFQFYSYQTEAGEIIEVPDPPSMASATGTCSADARTSARASSTWRMISVRWS